ncbi:uncharacterized protein ttc6 [Osmerus mordax]|uniref:uncharacterized protein ttc6 n=1 Tax=Osmerus mordax TaxID=8014 RepID=UPI00350EA2C0
MQRDRKLPSHSDEQKRRREVEALKRDCQKDILQMKKLFYDSHRNPSTKAVAPGAESAREVKDNSTWGMQLHFLALSLQFDYLHPVEFNVQLLRSPPASVTHSAVHPELLRSRCEEQSRAQGKPLKDLANEREAKEALDSARGFVCSGQKPEPRPVIAQLAGTTRVIHMTQRPLPPSKPRSEHPSTTTRTLAHKTNKSANQTKDSVNKPSDRSYRRSRGGRVQSSDSSEDESANSSDLGSDQSRSSSVGRRLGKKKKKRKARATRTPVEAAGGGGSVRSAEELLREAQDIAGVGPGEEAVGEDLHGQQSTPEEMVEVAKMLVRERGRTVDEIIASLQSGTNDTPSASDQMIKELMEKVLGGSYQEVVYTEVYVPQRWVRKEMSPSESTQRPDSSRIYKMATPGPEDQEDIVSMTTTLPHTVPCEDVLLVRGGAMSGAQRPRRVSLQTQTLQDLSLLATWRPKTSCSEYKTIHHLCTTPASHTFRPELCLASRVCHTPGMLAAPPLFCQQRAALDLIAAHPDRHRILTEGEPYEELPEEVPDSVVHLPPATSDSLADWQRIAEHYVEKPRMVMQGHMSPLCANELKMFWNPAPPKFSCSPAFIEHKLFPEYQATRHDLSSEELFDDLPDRVESGLDVTGTEINFSMENVLSRKFQSVVDLQTLQPSGDLSSIRQRPLSAPNPPLDPEASLKVSCDYATITKELQLVSQQLSSPARAAEAPLGQPASTPSQQDSPQNPPAGEELSPGGSPGPFPPQQQRRDEGRAVVLGGSRRRTSVFYGRRRMRGGKKLSPAKLAHIFETLKKPPRILIRSESMLQLSSKPPPKPHGKSPLPAPLSHCPSVPLVLDFQSFTEGRGGIPEGWPTREWVRDIWEVWFDEVFPPLDESNSTDCREEGPIDTLRPGDKERTPDEIQTLDQVDLSLSLEPDLTPADLEAEVARLSQTLAQQTDKPSPFHLCRRGALHRKLGRLNLALEDLNAAISLEPRLLNAYWHRHSIHLLRNKPSSALEDLNVIIKHNRKHADAFKSKAEIYRLRGENLLAIINYTQAIKCKPEDDENYFKRAQMYEKRKEILLAMEDYAKTSTINPKRTDALMIHGLHYFHSNNWMVALNDFTQVLQQDPGHSKARTYRASVYFRLGQHLEATEDFSLALHLDPNNWVAFYNRGCLLRRINPDMALKDLSTSVLINDREDNLKAFLHRGLLYTERKQWQQAVSDFEAVIKLDRSVAVAHVNLGLIYMLKMNQNMQAIKMFTNALQANPTYIRGYICRAQAYHRANDIKRALTDLTRATHMRPDAQQFYIMRGQYLCDMEQFDLATFCIQYAAEMNKALGSSPLQQAAVQCFLGNDHKAITCLEEASSNKPSLPILLLLGKTQMKTRNFMALDAFSNAVKINQDYAEAYHQRGLCRMRLQQSKSVQDFNRALSINPNLFQVYLSRAAFYGAQARYSKAILNCNEAIRIQPKSIRAFLYRGALRFYLKTYKGAVEDLSMAIRIDNTCYFAHYNRGVCYQQLKLYHLALIDYGIVLLVPGKQDIDLKVLINRALLYLELGDHESALQDFKAASWRSPEDANIYHALGVFHHRQGQLQDSVKAFSHAMQLSPFFLDAYVGRGNAYMDYGHAHAIKQAQRDFLSALHLDPLCSTARINLAYNLQVLGFFQRAWNQFTVAVEINPRSWIALEGRAVVSLQMGSTYAAFQDINSALKVSELRELLTNRGVINQYMGDVVGAMRDYQKAISVNPAYALAHFNAANLYFYNSRFEQACEYYSHAFELDPEDESALLNRAITRALLRKVPEALQDFSLALKLNPDSAHVYFNRANLYCSLRKYTLAERDFTQVLHLQPSDALVYKLRADVRGHLGWTQQAVEDYRTAVELQEGMDG